MNTHSQKYCLDTNVLIQAWQKYYSPNFCPDYWTRLSELGADNKIFVPQSVFDEITRTEDDLAKWLRSSAIPVYKVDEAVAQCLKDVYAANPLHQFLVDNTRQRSLADPWVIAHSLKEGACVVTKEEKVTAVNTNKIKIPNVCENMRVRWINDFDLIKEINMHFTCAIKSLPATL